MTMNICVFQPPYPRRGTENATKEVLQGMLSQLAMFEPGEYDLILLPEYANAPGIGEAQTLRTFAQKHGAPFMQELAGHAARLETAIALGAALQQGPRWCNYGVLFDAQGEIAFVQEKVHLVRAEIDILGLAPGSEVVVHEYQGLRMAFAICFDLYFPEYFAMLAAQKVDLILSPSYQRSEAPWRIRTLCQARAVDAGATLVRSSYAMGRGSDQGGASLVALPQGDITADAGDAPCMFSATVDVGQGFIKPASFGQSLIEHRQLIEENRRPALYRPAWEQKQAVAVAPTPRLCAHRGLSHACPENTLPAFAAALAVGVPEIEFDLWESRDGVAVVCHDADVDRTTDGQGAIADMEWAALQRLDAGGYLGEAWRGVRLPRLEEVLALVDGRSGLNIHLKAAGVEGRLVKRVCDLLREQALLDIAYIAGSSEEVLGIARDYAPEMARACLVGQDDPDRQIALAQQYGCQRVQFGRNVTEAQIDAAHQAGLRCNLFWSDEADDAREWVRRGIDVILTNAAHRLIADGFGHL